MYDMMTLAGFVGSKMYYISMIGGIIVLFIIYKVVRGRSN